MRGRASKAHAWPTMALSSRMRVALQRPSRAIVSTDAKVSKLQPANIRAVSSVNFHGAIRITSEGWTKATP